MKAQDRSPEAFVIIAHRGASGYLPEHTQEAVVAAYFQGADYIEQDVVLSKDDVPMVLHDVHLDTVTDVAGKFPNRARPDGRYYARDFTAAEIQGLRVSERFQPQTGKAVYAERFPVQSGGFRVPTLAEELEVIQGLNKSTGRDVGVYVEIKSPAWHRESGADISRITLEVLRKFGYDSPAANAFVQCFDPLETKRIREELGCKLKIIQLIGDNSWGEAKTDFASMCTAKGLAAVAEYADGIGPWINQLYQVDGEGLWASTLLVERAHSQGLLVHPYTARVDSLPKFAGSFDELMRLLIEEQAVDGVFTDFPDRAIRSRERIEKGPALAQ